MRIHAAAVIREIEHSTVRLGDEQLRGVGLPCAAHAGRFAAALLRNLFAVLVVQRVERRFAVHRVHHMVADGRDNDGIDSGAPSVHIDILTGRQLNRAVVGLQLELEVPAALGDSRHLTGFAVQRAQIAERDFYRAAGLHGVVVRHGFHILDGVVARIFVIEVAAAGRTVHAASDGAVRTLPVQVVQAGIRVFRAVERRTVLLFQRVGDKVVVAIEQNRIRGDGHAARRIACADRAANLVDDFGVCRRTEYAGKCVARGLEYAGCTRTDAQHQSGSHADRRDAWKTAYTMNGNRLLRLLGGGHQAIDHAAFRLVGEAQLVQCGIIHFVIIILSVHKDPLPRWCAGFCARGSGVRKRQTCSDRAETRFRAQNSPRSSADRPLHGICAAAPSPHRAHRNPVRQARVSRQRLPDRHCAGARRAGCPCRRWRSRG